MRLRITNNANIPQVHRLYERRGPLVDSNAKMGTLPLRRVIPPNASAPRPTQNAMASVVFTTDALAHNPISEISLREVTAAPVDLPHVVSWDVAPNRAGTALMLRMTLRAVAVVPSLCMEVL